MSLPICKRLIRLHKVYETNRVSNINKLGNLKNGVPNNLWYKIKTINLHTTKFRCLVTYLLVLHMVNLLNLYFKETNVCSKKPFFLFPKLSRSIYIKRSGLKFLLINTLLFTIFFQTIKHFKITINMTTLDRWIFILKSSIQVFRLKFRI